MISNLFSYLSTCTPHSQIVMCYSELCSQEGRGATVAVYSVATAVGELEAVVVAAVEAVLEVAVGGDEVGCPRNWEIVSKIIRRIP